MGPLYGKPRIAERPVISLCFPPPSDGPALLAASRPKRHGGRSARVYTRFAGGGRQPGSSLPCEDHDLQSSDTTRAAFPLLYPPPKTGWRFGRAAAKSAVEVMSPPPADRSR